MKKRIDRTTNDPFNPVMFSLSDFKKWMHKQQKESSSEQDIVGVTVESKIGAQRLIDKMDTEEDPYEIAKEFKKNGGTIAEVDGSKLMIATDAGSFIIHKAFVKRKD